MSRLALLLVALALSGCAAAPVFEPVQFRTSAARSGVFAGPELAAAPVQQWHYHTAAWVFTSPTLAGGTLYFGGFDKHFHALDAATGVPRWRRRFDSVIASAPAVDAARVYFGTLFEPAVYALDRHSGETVWRFATQGGVHSAPALHAGVLLLTDLGGWLYALDRGSGREVWRFSLLDADQRAALGPEGFKSLVTSFGFLGEDVAGSVDRMTHAAVLTSPVPANGVIYIGSFDGRLYALAAAEAQCSRRQTERASGARQDQASPCRLPAGP